MENKDLVTLIEDPLIQADFSRMTVGDFARLVSNPMHAHALMLKCITNDLDTISYEYAPMIMQAFMTHLGEFLKDFMAVHEMLKVQPDVAH